MRLNSTCAALAATALALSAPAPLSAYPDETVPEAMRSTTDPVALHIVVPQIEIRATINPAGGAGGAAQGGIVGALIVGAMESSRAKKSENKAEAIRIALDGFDADTLARAESARAFATLPWVGASAATFSKDPTLWGKMAVLDAGKAPHLATIAYSYELSPDFTTVTVSASVQIADKVNPKANKPEKRLAPEKLAFVDGAHVMIALPPGLADLDARFAAWTANDSTLLKEALRSGFAKAADLAARGMGVTPSDLATMTAKDRPKLNLGFHRGRIVEGQDSIASMGASNALVRASATVAPGKPGVTIWAGYFVHSQMLAVAQ